MGGSVGLADIADGSATGDAVTVEDYQELIPPS